MLGRVVSCSLRAGRLPLRSPPTSSCSRTRSSASPVAASTMSDWTLISFDVDGTLIHSIGQNANKLHKDSFKAAFREVYGTDTHIDVVEHHGSTDPLIILKVMEHHGLSRQEAEAKLPAAQQAMISHFLAHVEHAAEGIEILPGVQQLLAALQAHGRAASCLVTGNLEPIGWAKMRALGIEPLFTRPLFGGFGTDHCSGNVDESWRDRAEFVRVAAKKGQAGVLAEQGVTAGWGARWHVGDTPMDIRAALDAGAKALAVATGIFSKEQLAAVAPGHPDVVLLDSLEDTPAVLKVLGLA